MRQLPCGRYIWHLLHGQIRSTYVCMYFTAIFHVPIFGSDQCIGHVRSLVSLSRRICVSLSSFYRRCCSEPNSMGCGCGRSILFMLYARCYPLTLVCNLNACFIIRIYIVTRVERHRHSDNFTDTSRDGAQTKQHKLHIKTISRSIFVTR